MNVYIFTSSKRHTAYRALMKFWITEAASEAEAVKKAVRAAKKKAKAMRVNLAAVGGGICLGDPACSSDEARWFTPEGEPCSKPQKAK